jgi:hypothetical protein
MALPAHALEVVEVRLKSVNNEGHFTLQVETVFRPHLLSPCSGATEVCDMALHARALRAVQVRLKSVSNEGRFSLEAETVFPPYLPSQCSALTEICHMAVTAHCYMQCKLG